MHTLWWHKEHSKLFDKYPKKGDGLTFWFLSNDFLSVGSIMFLYNCL